MDKNFKVILIVAGMIVSMIIGVILTVSIKNSIDDGKNSLGEMAVKYLYEFRNAEELDRHMLPLSKITTEAVFNQLTIDNEERTLNCYLKFEGKPVKVNIIKSTDTYVLYSLETEKIDSHRLFIFTYNINNSGKIDYVREVEAIDFIDSWDKSY